jgi:hypothetical protein
MLYIIIITEFLNLPVQIRYELYYEVSSRSKKMRN